MRRALLMATLVTGMGGIAHAQEAKPVPPAPPQVQEQVAKAQALAAEQKAKAAAAQPQGAPPAAAVNPQASSSEQRPVSTWAPGWTFNEIVAENPVQNVCMLFAGSGDGPQSPRMTLSIRANSMAGAIFWSVNNSETLPVVVKIPADQQAAYVEALKGIQFGAKRTDEEIAKLPKDRAEASGTVMTSFALNFTMDRPVHLLDAFLQTGKGTFNIGGQDIEFPIGSDKDKAAIRQAADCHKGIMAAIEKQREEIRKKHLEAIKEATKAAPPAGSSVQPVGVDVLGKPTNPAPAKAPTTGDAKPAQPAKP